MAFILLLKRYNKEMKKVLFTLIGLLILALAWWAIVPLFTDNVVDEELPFDVSGIGMEPEVEDTTDPEVTFEDAPFEVIVDDTQAIETPAGTVILKTGEFIGADSFHQAKGTATIYNHSGDLFLELSNFEVTNGPDLFVNLSKHPSPRNKEELGDTTIQLARLKGNIGNQVYQIPSDVDISSFESAVIYCKAFGVIFGTANLK